MTDHEGNTITVGYKGEIMVECVAVLSNGTPVWQTAFSGMNLTGYAPDTHKGQPNWPGVPGG